MTTLRCYEDIYTIILKYKIDYTTNKHGLFFNITPFHENIIYDMDNTITQYENNECAVTYCIRPDAICLLGSFHNMSASIPRYLHSINN